MLDQVSGLGGLLDWMKRVIPAQFAEYIPIVREHDVFIAANTEFAAPSIAECCGKPLVRTAFAPLLPSRKIPPPVMPFPRANPLLPPRLLWGGLNLGLNLLMLRGINESRRNHGILPIRDQGQYAPSYSDNCLLYSPSLGNTDPDWPYQWQTFGYLFGDDIPYDEEEERRFMEFARKDDRPLLFFTTGSCKSPRRDFFYETLREVCAHRGYKLALGADWWKGEGGPTGEDVCVLNSFVPHARIFPHCTAIAHHGGSGTTHSAARSGRPQLVMPLLIDQFYWGERVRSLGLGPEPVKVKSIKADALARRIIDLIENPAYLPAARETGELVRQERGLEAFVEYIEKRYG
jgi:UDP:flavonoid glycosyltransferase YjiC (YdhE family)